MNGYSIDGEKTWWQAVHRHLKNAEVAALNAMAHNLDDQDETFQLQDTIASALTRVRAICEKKGVSL